MVRPLVVTEDLLSRGAGPDRTIRSATDWLTLARAVAQIGNVHTTIVIDRNEPVAADLTIPANIHLHIVEQGILQIAPDATLTIASPENIIAPPRQQIFDCQTLIAHEDGAVAWTGGGTVHPGWWGALADGATDDTEPLQRAINTLGDPTGVCVFQAGVYRFDQLTLPEKTHLRGQGPGQTYLIRTDTAAGIGIEDEDSAQNIVIEEMQIDGNDVDAVLVQLGHNSEQFAVWAMLSNLLLRDSGTSYALDVNGNVGYFQELEIWNSAGFHLDGNGNHLRGLAFSGCTPYGLTIDGGHNEVVQCYGEGACTALILIKAENGDNRLVSIRHHIGEGLTIDQVVDIEADARLNTIHGLCAVVDGTLTNGLVRDLSNGTRIVPGQVYTTWHTLALYHSGSGYEIQLSPNNGIPMSGTWRNGDRSRAYVGTAGWGGDFQCMTGGAPGAWGPLSTIPGAVAKTADYSIVTADNGVRFSNAGALGAVDIDLPDVAVNLEYEFIKTTAQAFTITPQAGEQINAGGAGVALTLVNVGDCVRVGYEGPGLWRTIRDNR